MELRDLEYFAIVAEHGNLRRAAEALDLSQPALSKSLRRLESSAQSKLVKRTPKGVELTAVGAALLAHARRLRLSLDDAGREIVDLSQGRLGRLRVGAGPSMADNVLPSACESLFKDAPNVTLKIAIATNDVLMPALRSGELDLTVSGIPTPPYEDLVQEHLYDDDLVVIASAHHRLARRKSVTMEELGRERWALAYNVLSERMLHRSFENYGLSPPEVAVEVSESSLRFHVVSTSNFLGFAPRGNLRVAKRRYQVVEIPVKGVSWLRQVGVSYREDAYLSPAARRFIDILKATAKKISTHKP
jgi:DNA-binding transcriptional LysR family regulator